MQSNYSWHMLFRNLAIWAAFFAIANTVIYWTCGYFEKQRNYRNQVQAIFERPTVRVLFAGDSHIATPLNDYLNSIPRGAAFSIAAGGDGMRECYAKVRYILNQCQAIHTLIVSADPHMFGRRRLESSNRSYADVYFLATKDPAGLKRGLLPTLMNQIPLFNDDFVQYIRRVSSMSLIASSRSASGGSPKSAPAAWDLLSEEERTTKAYAVGRKDNECAGEYVEPFRWYRQLLDLARSRKLRVVGVRMPVHRGYAAQIPQERVAAIDDFLRGNGMAAIVDLRDLFDDPVYFEDPDHVKRQWAETLVRVLEDRLGLRLIDQPDWGTP